MSQMMNELAEAKAVVSGAISACVPIAKQIVDEIKRRNIKRVFLAGRGSSLHAGIAFKFFLETLTDYSLTFEYPSIATVFDVDRDLSDSLYIVVSQSGAGPDTIAFANKAKAQGALTVACCNYQDAPLSQICDYLLYLSAGEEKAVAATKTLTAEIVALEILAYALAGKEIPSDFASVGLDSALNAKIGDFSPVLISSKQVVCLSRLLTEAVAKECGLKLMETCYLFTYSSSVNEFQHGPKALVSNGLPVILFAPDGNNKDNYVAVARDLKEKGAYLVAFTDIDDVKAVADFTVDMPTVADYEQTVVYLVAMQRFVALLCDAKGLNPDAPRNLNKVTITN